MRSQVSPSPVRAGGRRPTRQLMAALELAYPAPLLISVAAFLIWVFDYFRAL